MIGPYGSVFGVEIEFHVVAMAGHGDVGQRVIHRLGREHICAVYSCALRFMDCHGVAMIETSVVMRVDADLTRLLVFCVQLDR